jgi:2-alkenal reductase
MVLGCAALVVIALVAVVVLATSALGVFPARSEGGAPAGVTALATAAPPQPTFTAAAPTVAATTAPAEVTPVPAGAGDSPLALVDLYRAVNPGVVNIQVVVEQAGGAGVGAGSGFVLDEQGHIVTNNHVVAGARDVTVIFHDGFEAPAEVVGTDPDSDLAVVRVAQLPEGVHPLTVGDSDTVQVGEWVIAIGNPFGYGSSMSLGIVSATGRTIASGVTPFDIPQAIQTDAAINPGNSGGPLLNLAGAVIGVNAQIATAGIAANSGVGFAIPANVVRQVAPALIRDGAYQWPWLGVRGDAVSLLVAEANGLDTQFGAYIHEVVPGGPAEAAGLRGSTGVVPVDGVPVPVGGDVVVEANGEPVIDFADLLVDIAFAHPGDDLTLTILRAGEREQVTVTLAPRPANGDSLQP